MSETTRKKMIQEMLYKSWVIYVPLIASTLASYLGSLAISVDEWTELLCAFFGLVASVFAIFIYKREKQLKANIVGLRESNVEKDNNMISMAVTTKQVADIMEKEWDLREKRLEAKFQITIQSLVTVINNSRKLLLNHDTEEYEKFTTMEVKE